MPDENKRKNGDTNRGKKGWRRGEEGKEKEQDGRGK